MAKEKIAVITLDKNQIKVLSNCCGESLKNAEKKNIVSTGDLLKEGELNLEAGKGICGWCKAEMEYPEVRVKIFK